MSQRTYSCLVLDKSGSMANVRLATVSTYNEQVEQIKIDALDGQDIRAGLVTFNRDTYEHLWDVPASEMPLSSFEGYIPGGGTNIWDAIGYVIDRWERETNTSDPNNFYVMTIISDGQHEDPNCKRKPEQLNREVTSRQATGRWTFSFLGCDKNYLENFAKQTGIPISNMGTWSNVGNIAAAVSAGSNVKQATSKYFMARKEGKNVATNFYSDDNERCADFAAAATTEAAAVDALIGSNQVWSVGSTPNTTLTPEQVAALQNISNLMAAEPTRSSSFAAKGLSTRGPMMRESLHSVGVSPTSYSYSGAASCSMNPTPDVLTALNLNSTPERPLANVFGTSKKV